MRYKSILMVMFLSVMLMSSVAIADTFQVGGSTGGECDYDVGEVVNLPQISTDVIPDYFWGDGDATLLYCSWETSDGQGQSLMPMNTGDLCPTPMQTMELEYGDNIYMAVITSVDANIVEGNWQFGNAQVLNQTQQTYNACYEEPDPGFIASVVAFILNWLCSVFSFSWCV